MNTLIKDLTQNIINSIYQRKDSIQHFDATPLPNKATLYKILEDLKFLLFPGYFGETDLSFDSIEEQIAFKVVTIFEQLKTQVLREALHFCKNPSPDCKQCQDYSILVCQILLSKIPEIREILDLDVKAAYKNDPAANSYHEIIFSYPGIEAITTYRIAHILFEQGLTLIPRILTEYAHSKTGIDIHPGAKIGPGFFIDHGTGVVIGETTEIGCNVTIYQGVTLGALNFPKDAQGNLIRKIKRHPTIEPDVVIYAGATILGGNTVIGRGSIIGGNVWITESVPPYSRVVMAKNELSITPRKVKPQSST